VKEQLYDVPLTAVLNNLKATTYNRINPANKGDKSKKMSSFINKSPAGDSRSFSLSMEAFDALMDDGMALETTNGGIRTLIIPSSSVPSVAAGSRMEVQVTAMSWEGSSESTTVIGEGVVSFTQGQKQVTLGLDQASLYLAEGAEATITVSPNLAYGFYGRPPLIGKNVNIIYDIKVLSVQPPVAEGDEIPTATGPEILLGGITPQEAGIKEKPLRVRSVVLDSAPVTDEMLAQAAAAMGISKKEEA
jgi:FKBP-type peptidyl-prolyl cis-trans isomerase